MLLPSYDDLWRTVWGDIQCFGPVHRHIAENLVHTVSALNVRTVLDVGCGSGQNLAALASLGQYGLTGVDISQEALQRCGRLVPLARVLLLDIEHEKLPEQFDLVMSIQVVEHLVDDVAAFRNIAEMARAYVFISTIQGRPRPSESAIGHVRNYSAIELRSKLESVGLEVMQLWGWGFPFYSPLYRSLVEWLPGGPPIGAISPGGKLAAYILYHLYRLNWPGRGDVLNALARRL
jgi:SAM-dependent methyltransferase